MLASFMVNRKDWRSFIAKYGGLTSSESKTFFLSMLYNNPPSYEVPFILALYNEMYRASQLFMSDGSRSYLHELFGSRDNPSASRLHYGISAIEDKLLEDLCESVGTGNHKRTGVLMFDGFIRHGKPNDCFNESVRVFESRNGVSLAVNVM